MGKYEDIQKLQELKEKGSITENEFETEKQRILNAGNNKKQSKMLSLVVIILIIIAVIAGLCLLADNMWSSSGTHAKNQLGNSSNFEEEIIDKWKATLPMNNTNGLECVAYNANTQTLYLKYNFGICIVDSDDEVNRYMSGEPKYDFATFFIQEAKENTENENSIYMTAKQFEEIIEDI